MTGKRKKGKEKVGFQSNILQRIDAVGRLLDFPSNDLRNELCELGEGTGRSLALDDLSDLFADGTDLRGAGVSSLLDLVWSSLCKRNGK